MGFLVCIIAVSIIAAAGALIGAQEIDDEE